MKESSPWTEHLEKLSERRLLGRSEFQRRNYLDRELQGCRTETGVDVSAKASNGHQLVRGELEYPRRTG